MLEEHRIIQDLLFLAEVAPNLVTECEDGLNDLLLIELVVFIFFLASNALDSTDGRSSSSSAHPGDPTASAALLKADLGRARAELSRARVRAADEHHRRDSLFTKAKRLLENEVDRRQFLEKRLGVVGGGAGTGTGS